MNRTRHLRGIAWTPAIAISSLVSNVLALSLPIALIHVYDRVIPSAGTQTLAVLWIGLGVAVLCDLALRLARGHLVDQYGIRYEIETRNKLLAEFMSPGAPVSQARNDAEIQALFGGIERIRRRRSGDMAKAVLDVPFILIFAAILSLISLPLAVIVFAVTAVCVLAVFTLRRRGNRLFQDRLDDDTSYLGFLGDTLRQFDMIHDLALGERMRREAEFRTARSGGITEALTQSRLVMRNTIATIGLMAPVIVAAVGAGLAISGQMSIGGLAAAVVLTGRIVQPSLNLEALLTSNRDVLEAERALDAVLEASAPTHGSHEIGPIESLSLPGAAGEPVVLKRGECLLIDAEDPSEVSALFDLLIGCAAPGSDGIAINGVPIEDADPGNLLQRATLLRSDYTLLEGTLLENLTGFEPEQHRTSALDLAARLGLDQTIAQTEHGLYSELSHGHLRRLSRSTCQLVHIVSGLAKQPDLVLFLEANVDLDAESDSSLRKVLAQEVRNCITLLFTHRPSYRALAGRRATLSGMALREETDQSGRPAAEKAYG